MTPEQKADEIISDLNDRSLGIEYLDDDIQDEIKEMIINFITK